METFPGYFESVETSVAASFNSYLVANVDVIKAADHLEHFNQVSSH